MKNKDTSERLQNLAEQLLWQSCDNSQELFATVMSLACRILEHMTDEETAVAFNQKTGELFYDSIRKYSEKIKLMKHIEGETRGECNES